MFVQPSLMFWLFAFKVAASIPAAAAIDAQLSPLLTTTVVLQSCPVIPRQRFL